MKVTKTYTYLASFVRGPPLDLDLIDHSWADFHRDVLNFLVLPIHTHVPLGAEQSLANFLPSTLVEVF